MSKTNETRIDNDFKQLVNDFCERNPKLFCENHPKMTLNPNMIALRSGYSNGVQIDKYWSDEENSSIPNGKLMNKMLDVMRQHEPDFEFKLDRYKAVKE